MALDVGTLVARIVVDPNGVRVGVAQARAQLSLLGSGAGGVGSALDGIGSHGSSMGDRISAAARTGVLALAGVATAAVAGAGAIAGFGLKSAANLEQTTVAFTSLLGSADLAKQQLAQLQQFAAATPFSQQDVLGLAQQYYAFAGSVGLAKTDVQSYLTAIGDVGAVTGASAANIKNAGMAIGQIGSSGKVTLDNLNQISEAFPGFNAAAAIASATGQTTAQVMDQIHSGSLDATTGVQALIKGMQQFPGAAGAMAAQSQTLTGLWSTFTDTIQISLTQAFAPMIPMVKDTLGQLTPVISSALGTVAPQIASFFANLVPLIAPLIGVLSQALGAVLGALGPALAALAPVIAPLGQAFTALVGAAAPLLLLFAQIVAAVAGPLLGILSALFTALQPVFQTLQTALQPALAALQPALAALIPPITALATTLGTALVGAITQLAPLLPQLITSAVGLIGAFVQLLVAVSPMIPVLVQFVAMGMQVFATFNGAVIAALTGVVNAIANSLAPAFQAFAPLLLDLINKFGDRLAPLLMQVAPMVITLMADFVQFGAAIGQAVIPILVSLLSTFLTVAGGIINAAADMLGWVPGVGGKLNSARDSFNAFSGQAQSALQQVKNESNINVTANTADALQHIYAVQGAISNLISMAAGAARAQAGMNIDIGVSGAGTAGRALGGPVSAKTAYLVGEQGPEIFTPDTDGRIIPNGKTNELLNRPADKPIAAPDTAASTGVSITNYITGWEAEQVERYNAMQAGVGLS